MGRKSKAIVVSEHTEIDEKEFHKLIEKHFKKLMGETKTERYKLSMKFIEKFNPENYGSLNSLGKTIRLVIMLLYIEICNLEKERDEALLLREYEEGTT